MAKYIDLEAAVKLLRNQAHEALEYSDTECEVLSSVADELEDFPPADVVPVVRCKDCVYSRPRIAAEKEFLRENVVICTAISSEYFTKWEDDFCSEGVRKEASNGGDTD
nr:MAG TPA: hypothetical protein [Ackermannviridae sp.]